MLKFTDSAGVTRLEGSLSTTGGATGDVLTVQADGSVIPAAGGGSQPLCYQVTLGFALFPMGGEVVGTGLMLAVGDRVIDVAASVAAGTTASDLLLGANAITGTDKLCGVLLNCNDPDDGGPYSGAIGSGHFYDDANAEAADGQGRLPCTVLTAHELMVTNVDSMVAGSITLSIYVIRAADVVTLPAP